MTDQTSDDEMKIYPQWYLRLRRKILSWIQGRQAGQQGRYWSNIDQQERHPGDLGFSHMEQANSPKYQYIIEQKWVHQKKRVPWYTIPLFIHWREVVYRIRCRMPHPEWGWSLQNGERGPMVRTILAELIKFMRDWLFGIHFVVGVIETLWDSRIGLAAILPYPPRIRIRLKECDYQAAQKCIAEAERKFGCMSALGKHKILRTEMIKNSLARHLWLNRPWMECVWTDFLRDGVHQSAVIIRLSRTGRIFARYQLPSIVPRESPMIGWTPGSGYPKKSFVLVDTPEPILKGRINTLTMRLEQSSMHDFTEARLTLVDTDALAKDGCTIGADLGISRFQSNPLAALRIMATELRTRKQPIEKLALIPGDNMRNLETGLADVIAIPQTTGSGFAKTRALSLSINPDWTIEMVAQRTPDDIYADTWHPFRENIEPPPKSRDRRNRYPIVA